MRDSGVLFLTGADIIMLADGLEDQIVATVRGAYVAHSKRKTVVPNSVFLRIPTQENARIIALPAWVGSPTESVGIKWISSFPSNLSEGMDRAAAVIVLNSIETGRPLAILEGSVISAKRTVASAALFLDLCVSERAGVSLCLCGCGNINYELLHFLQKLGYGVKSLRLFDTNRDAARRFASLSPRLVLGDCSIEVCDSPETAVDSADIVSFATTSTVPYFDRVNRLSTNAVVVHLSLRDLTPRAIVLCDNVVDDFQHTAREGTSIAMALAEDAGNMRKCKEIGELLSEGGRQTIRAGRSLVFSPFGLGALDIAVGTLILERARRQHVGTHVAQFIPPPWHERIH